MAKKREYIASIKCAHDGCKEWVHYRCDNAKDEAETFNRHNRVWKCPKHRNPERVIKPDNLSQVYEITYEAKYSYTDSGVCVGMFWRNEQYTNGQGLVTAHPLLAYSEGFPKGTKLRIRIEMEAILPDDESGES